MPTHIGGLLREEKVTVKVLETNDKWFGVTSLREQVDYLTQKLFSTSSEKSKMVPGQINLFDEAEQEYRTEEEGAEETHVSGYTRKAKSKSAH